MLDASWNDTIIEWKGNLVITKPKKEKTIENEMYNKQYPQLRLSQLQCVLSMQILKEVNSSTAKIAKLHLSPVELFCDNYLRLYLI